MGKKGKKAVLAVDNQDEALALFGRRDEHLKYIERETGMRVTHSGGKATFEGPEAKEVARAMERLLKRARTGEPITVGDIKFALMSVEDGDEGEKTVKVKVADGSGRVIKPQSPAQGKYLEAMRGSDMVFAVGPAGTGKTFLAVATAVGMLLDESVKRIIICRPAVEAGENLGFLPGDFQQKVDPYLRPVYDALFGMLTIDRCARYLDRGIIEVAPLAYMRGRTLEDAFVIMDEAQNTTVSQMKMFLTRLGRNSRAAVTGDVTQTDLPPGVSSGLEDAVARLRSIKEISFIFFTKRDVVRHDLVAKIIEAYEGPEEEKTQD